jgi:outer membrane protein OmpA-like peptidoglycan-associated protein
MGMKKDCADFEKSMQESAKNESLSKDKISKLAALLSEAEKSTIDKDADIAKLIKERDAAIQAAMGMQKKLEAGKKASAKNAKKIVLDNIVNTFKLSKVEFKTGSAILTEKSTGLLDKVADIIKAHSEYHYKIQGHTDSQGKKESNLRLSEKRAKSVKDYLISKGVSDKLLSSKGFGSSNPIADNATKDGRLQNRRVVFEIVD